MRHLTIKTLIAILALLILLTGAFFGLTEYREYRNILTQVNRNVKNLDQLAATIEALEQEAAGSSRWFAENLHNNIKFMKDALKDLVVDGRYTGPGVFREGIVVQLDNNKVIYPKEVKEGFIDLTADMIRKGCAEDSSGNISITDGIIYPEGEEPKKVLLTFGQISDNYYYVDYTGADEFKDYLDIHSNVQGVLDAAESTYGGALFLVKANEEEEKLEIQNTSSRISAKDALQLTETLSNLIDKKIEVVRIDSFAFCGMVSQVDETRYLILLLPYEYNFHKKSLTTLILILLMTALAAAVITYLIRVQKHIKTKKLKSEQAEALQPKKILKKVISIGLIYAIIIFAMAAFLEELSSLQNTTEKAQTSLQRLVQLNAAYNSSNTEVQSDTQKDDKQENNEEKDEKSGSESNSETQQASEENAEANTENKTTSAEASDNKKNVPSVRVSAQSEEEEWYVYYAEQMVQFLTQFPKLKTSEKLQEFCDDLVIDYIMLFDGHGKETLCNKPYSDFSLGTGQGEDGEDFLRLLQGVPSIVHSASEDALTGIKRQYIGVTVPSGSNSEPHGALIMSLLPERTMRTTENADSGTAFKDLNDTDIVYFTADGATGQIIDSSNPSLTNGLNVSNFGLEETSLKDGYMDFISLNGTYSYVVTKAADSVIYYCLTSMSSILSSLLVQGLLAVGSFVIIFIVLLLILFFGFTQRAFDKWAVISEEDEEDTEETEEEKEYKGFGHRWRHLLPEAYAGKIFYTLMSIFLLAIVVYELNHMGHTTGGGVSLIQFIMTGGWMKGLNLFSVSAIILVIIITFLIVAIIKWFLGFLPSIMSHKGETVKRLLSSTINYIAVILVIYIALDYLGFNPSAIVAGLGVVGLALSFGAKDMIADIFAGVNILVENSFQVGDYVEIGGFKGTVLTIGIRTTRIKGSGGKVKVFNNKDIRDVINMSCFDTSVNITFGIPITIPFSRISEIMERELPKIAQKTDLIMGEPYFSGIKSVEKEYAYIEIGAKCTGRNYSRAKAFLYEEILEMLKAENVELIYKR